MLLKIYLLEFLKVADYLMQNLLSIERELMYSSIYHINVEIGMYNFVHKSTCTSFVVNCNHVLIGLCIFILHERLQIERVLS